MRYVGGIDIGGTKCAVSIGRVTADKVETVKKCKIPTPREPEEAINSMIDMLKNLLEEFPDCPIDAIGISCGSPLDSAAGIILAPPNLPHWTHVDVVTPFEKAFQVPAGVQNDANACALAEWMWGAGKGSKNMIFLTFGTGMGAGLILDGRLYVGTNDMAGEVGHIRLEKEGPMGYHKIGSFEGFCSGGGIGRMGRTMVKKHLEAGGTTCILKEGESLEDISALSIGIAAGEKDPLALAIMEKVGEKLGMGLSVLIDILNPQTIVIGSIFLRQEAILRPAMERIIEEEAISYNRDVCTIKAAGLGEELGDFAAYSVAMNRLQS